MKSHIVYTPQLNGYSKHLSGTLGYALDGYALDGYMLGDTFSTEPIGIHGVGLYSATISCPATGSPSYTMKLQGSNSREIDGEARTPDSNFVWFDVAAGGARIVSGAILNASVVHLTDPEAGYRWFRIVGTRTGGTMICTIKISRKEGA